MAFPECQSMYYVEDNKITYSFSIPYSDRPVATASIKHTLSSRSTTSPLNDVDTGTVPAKGILTATCECGPYTNGTVF